VTERDLVRREMLDGDVALLTLADPGRRNALHWEMTRALGAAVRSAVTGGAAALVLTAEPPVFCAGGSLDDLLEPKATLDEIHSELQALAETPVVTIAAVNGPAVGAGVNLPLFCDVAVASPAARFDPRWLDVGIHPGGGHLWRLERRVGRQAAAALVLCGETLDGPAAAERGLVWRCVPEEELVPEALRLARRAAGRDREVVARTKATLDASTGLPDVAEAVALETGAQAWSMARPGFRDRILALKGNR
jgi:enoyl-CoA hydratase